MSENRAIHLVDIPIGGKDGSTWNRLHGEREDICEILLKHGGPAFASHRDYLQARLRRVDDALDRLMSGSYGHCSRCGRPIGDAKLAIDPTSALCAECGGPKPENTTSSTADVEVKDLNAFDTIILRTQNSDYRILLLDPTTGRALIEGGIYLSEPSEALLKGSVVRGSEFKGGSIRVGSRLEMWVDDKVFITSPVKEVYVRHNGAPELVQNVSTALH